MLYCGESKGHSSSSSSCLKGRMITANGLSNLLSNKQENAPKTQRPQTAGNERREEALQGSISLVRSRSRSRSRSQQDTKIPSDDPRAFLRKPGPQNDLLIRERTHSLHQTLVLKERRIKELEQQLRALHGIKRAPVSDCLLQEIGVQVKTLAQKTLDSYQSPLPESDTIQTLHLLQKELAEVIRVAHKAVVKLNKDRDKLQRDRDMIAKVSNLSRGQLNHTETCTEELRFAREKFAEVQERLHLKELRELKLSHELKRVRSKARDYREVALQIRDDGSRNKKESPIAFRRAFQALSSDFKAKQFELEQLRQKGEQVAKKLGMAEDQLNMMQRKSTKRNASFFTNIRRQALLDQNKSAVFEGKSLGQLQQAGGTRPALESLRQDVPSTPTFTRLESSPRNLGFSQGRNSKTNKGDEKTHMLTPAEEAKEESKELIQRRRSTLLGAQLMAPMSSNEFPLCDAVLEAHDTPLPEPMDLRSVENFGHVVHLTTDQEDTLEIGDFDETLRINRQLMQMRSLIEVLKQLHVLKTSHHEDELRNAVVPANLSNGAHSKPVGYIGSEEKVMEVIAKCGGACCEAQTARLYVYDKRRHVLWYKSNETETVIKVMTNREYTPTKMNSVSESSIVSFVFANREAVHIEPELFDSKEFKGNLLAIPVLGPTTRAGEAPVNQSVCGVLVVSRKVRVLDPESSAKPKPSYFTELDEAVAHMLADHIALVLHGISVKRNRLLEKRLNDTIHSLPHRLHLDFTLPESSKALASQLEQAAKQIVHGADARIFMIDLERPDLSLCVYKKEDTDGIHAVVEHYDLVPGNSIATKCILSGHPEAIPDVNQHESFNANIDLRAEIYRGAILISVPLLLPLNSLPFAARWALVHDKTLLSNLWNSLGNMIVLGCLQVQLPLSANPSSSLKESSQMESSKLALSKFAAFAAVHIDAMWQVRLIASMPSNEPGGKREEALTQREQILQLRAQAVANTRKISQLEKQLRESQSHWAKK